jgi:GNAT superfamily N-acetyltransferase
MSSALIRPARDGDMGFIVDTWRQSFGPESYLFKFNRDLYFRLMAMHINGLARAGATISVACAPTDEDTIIGYVAHTGSELHYVYVREALRKHGVARGLLEHAGVQTYSFKTAQGLARLKAESRGWTFVPRVEKTNNGKFSVEMG